ncbi:MAG: methylated-DNA--[protein]-cysteine S-methyltransferase [Rubripirellula sp.]
MPRSKASNACTGNVQITQHASPLGPLWSHWTPKGLHQLSWRTPASDHAQQDSSVPNKQVGMLDTLLQDYFEGKNVSWHDLVLDPTGWTPFTQRVYRHCLEIPLGHTITYQELARLAGNEKASRAVGAAMSRNRILLIIPCHRVVSTSGNLQGYSAKGGINTKRLLLELERQGQWPHDLFDQGQNR